jgi:hypothetical protein
MTIFAVYFSFLALGPIYMRNRKPFKLDTTIRIYNLFQIAACSTFAGIGYFNYNYNTFENIWRCTRYEDYVKTSNDMLSVFKFEWYFLILRIIELVETVFFILRKKQKQVSFLHCYHHVSTIFFFYLVQKYTNGE